MLVVYKKYNFCFNNITLFPLQEDKVWEWDRIFTEVASELQTEWEKNNLADENE